MIGKRKHGWIGIDFGTKVAKVAQLECANNQVVVHQMILERSNGDGNVTCDGARLREALEVSGRFSGRTVACTLSMSSTDLRAMNIPPGTDAERRAMIAQELEAAYSDNVAREFDFWETEASGVDGVNVVSVAKTAVDGVTETLAAAGLECAVLDGLPCALARAVAMSANESASGPLAAVDWGYANATVAIVEQGRPQFTRALRDCGAGAMFTDVAQALGLNEAEAAEVLTRFGLPNCGREKGDRYVLPERPEGCFAQNVPVPFFPLDEIAEVVADIVGGQLQRMVDELSRTFSFLRLQRQALLPKQMLLFGAGGTVRNSAAFLASRLEIPCDVWRLANHEPENGQTSGETVFGAAAALSALAWST